MSKMKLYLDNAATTPIAPEVLKEMNDFSEKYFANPSSQHSLGREVKKRIDESRKKIADFVGAEEEEIIFTSGGTEADNISIRGIALGSPNKKHIITTVVEHPAVYDTCEQLKKEGYRVDYISVNTEGLVEVEDVKKKITKDTLLVSVMHVNNEIGTIQPIREIGKICKEKGVYFHTDAVQSFNKLDINVKELDVDLFSVSGHKINGPKGIGFLYSRIGTKMKPLVTGGGQEFNFRSGTENTVGIIGMAKALDVEINKNHIGKVRDYIIDKLKKMDGVKINGSEKERIYHNINASFYGIEGESLMLLLDEEGISVSTGSACSSKKLEESRTLKALNVDELYIHGSLRITLGNDMDFKKADYLIEKIANGVEKLRKMSPFKLEDEK